ncbi:MAG: hypothetical protein IPO36_02215 [Anaerolineales bacterium]|nr:hypothetical protein [Anaerolineales bacterium]
MPRNKVSLEEEIKGSKKEQKKVQANGCGSTATGFGCFTGMGIGIVWLVSLFSASIIAIGLACILFTIAAVIAIWIGVSDHLGRKEKQRNGVSVEVSKEFTSGYRYYCHICGNHWKWMIGTPYPKVTVRPDLLARVEAQRWTCAHCGSSNDGTRTSCYVCTYPKLH